MSPVPDAPGEVDRRSLLARVEERFIVPVHTSRLSPLWVAARDALALPVLVAGRVLRASATVDGEPVRLVLIGRPKRFDDLLAQLCDDAPGAEPTGDRRVLWHPDALARTDADLVAAEIHPWSAPRFRRAGWTVLPGAVRWVGRTDEIPPARPSTSLASDLAKVRKHGYRPRTADSPDEWEVFFERILFPHVERRFGDDAWRPSRSFWGRIATSGTLLFAERDDDPGGGPGGCPISGVCAVPAGDTLWAAALGVRDGDPALLREGAVAAVYAFLFEWARERGFERVDMGRTAPFPDDGLAHYKGKWGLRPGPDPLTHRVALRPGPGASAVRRALRRVRPFVETPDGIAPFRGDADAGGAGPGGADAGGTA